MFLGIRNSPCALRVCRRILAAGRTQQVGQDTQHAQGVVRILRAQGVVRILRGQGVVHILRAQGVVQTQVEAVRRLAAQVDTRGVVRSLRALEVGNAYTGFAEGVTALRTDQEVILKVAACMRVVRGQTAASGVVGRVVDNIEVVETFVLDPLVGQQQNPRNNMLVEQKALSSLLML
jgi:hypothetical protein